MKRGAAKFVTKLLTEDQMENPIKLYLELKNRISKNSNFIKLIIMVDKI